MKVLSIVALLFASAQAFDVKPKINGRRALLNNIGAAIITTGTVALTTKEKAGALEPMQDKASKCELDSPFDIPNLASCYGENRDMTPAQEAYANSLMTKFGIDAEDIKSE